MTRIDQPPVAIGPIDTDGHQLQRRVLQDLERQWLDSWSEAHTPHEAEVRSASPAATTTLPATVAVGASAAATQGPGATARPPRDAQGTQAPPHGRAAGSHGIGRQHASADRQSRSDQGSPGAAAAQSASVAGVGTELQPAAWAPQAMGSLASSPVNATAAAVALQVAAAAPAAAPAAVAGSTHLPPDAVEEQATGTRMPHRSSPKPDLQFGTHRFMLRELAQDSVQASLRDAQLDLAASQRAAQGLARALMEAGYAQVKVVVNGQRSGHDHGGDTSATASLDAPATASTDAFTDPAPKDPVHGN